MIIGRVSKCRPKRCPVIVTYYDVPVGMGQRFVT